MGRRLIGQKFFIRFLDSFLCIGTTLLFFQSSGNVLSSNIVLKSNYSGKAIDFPHDCIIRIDISSQPWALLALRFFIIKRRSFSLISNDFNRLFVLKLKTGSVPEF